MEEQEIIAGCLQNNPFAQRYLFGRNYRRSYHVAMRYLSNHHDTEDVLSISFTRVFKNIGHFENRGEGSLQKWINTIVINEAIRFLKTKKTLLFQEEENIENLSLSFEVGNDFQEIIPEILSELPEKDRHLRYLEYKTDPQTNKIRLTENRPSGHLDMLSLQAGEGANVYRSRFLTDITGEIGLQLNHKGILRNQFYVSNNLLFSFDTENSSVINNFTNFGYRRNLSNERGNPNWLGVEIGILTKRSGEIFQPNAMRLGVNWNVGKHITVSPQLYWNGFFQQVSPGFRIGIGL